MTKIDIVSGFLGAGKTTFANILLDYYLKSSEKTVYIVNEFGKTGLDGKIISSKGFLAFEMPNGCVCCSLQLDITTNYLFTICSLFFLLFKLLYNYRKAKRSDEYV